ncbi:MAG: ABC transporter permease, partial [Anaerolineaceae bacterium]|nr:ABC transporter permease [Anaerolineaceae bacterium]
MSNYIIRRLVIAVFLVFVLVAIVFFMLRTVVPGDPISYLAGDHATPEMIEQLRINYGLAEPVYVQFIIFLKNALKGDLGISIFTGLPVTDRIVSAYPVTIRLTFYSVLYSMVAGVLLGIITAYFHDTWLDNVVRVIAVTFASIPTFWLGLLLILIFAVWLGVLPVQGDMLSLEGLLLPAISLGTGSAASLARLVRAAMLE